MDLLLPTADLRPVDSLKVAPHNSRVHTEAQIAQIAQSMETFGWTMPVLIDEDSNVIAGHARLRAAAVLGVDTAPCLVAEGWSEDKKRAYLIADNKLSENSTWDQEVLNEQITLLNENNFDLTVLGFESFQIDGIIGDLNEEFFDLDTSNTAGDTSLPKDFKEPSRTADGFAAFSVVMPVDKKRKALATLRRIIEAGLANNYSEALTYVMEEAHGQHP